MRTVKMVKRVLTEMLRDKRTLALMFLAPLLILTLMYFLFQSNTDQTASLGIRNVDTTLVKAIKNDHVHFHDVSSKESAKTIIRDHDYAGLISQKGDQITLTLQNSDQSKSAILKQSLQKAQIKLKMEAAATAIKGQQKTIKAQQRALSQMQKSLSAASKTAASENPSAARRQVKTQTPLTTAGKPKSATTYSVNTHYLYGSSDSTFFDTLLPIMIGFVVFFFVFLISGIALLRERTTGTLNRLLATPIKRGEIISGYLAGYGIFALIQTLLIVGFTILAFKIQILGSVWNILLINILLAFVALAMGLFISTFASSEFQMVQFIPVVVIPQIFFSGIIPIDQMANWLQPIARIMPLYYGASAMSNVIEKGVTFMDILPKLGILVGFAALFLILNIFSMRRYRQV
ncbi:ABC transporter permease [Lentilactobacillus hilgardii]|uniref:ABC transporter permease n=1 Tax=Lentilactobacillus hilgardii TaxID=1588 RepID=A0A6P1E0W6_LENHI|nr:ABC transporter permease [Lentilactobacillus hilgardii]EEI72249.1 putative ABC transporter [Lentilactobacillus hilgardii ATCC 27305]MCT3392560.1 ABC transporter permease [Lentilactobacillus hilgardii]QHB50926.1 ABC transporter permease [Lentilactobacillus hilgardii]RRG08039.1 MAG: ABC transporter permease [Lactobacillus sp.]